MGQPQRYTISDLAGGLNEGAHITDLVDNEMTQLENWYPWARRLRRRGGTTRVSATAAYPDGRYDEALSNTFAYKTSVGDFSLIVGGATSLGILQNNALTKLPHLQSVTYVSSNLPWSFRQYKDITYAARDSVGTLQRTNGSVVDDAGIVAPLTAPTISEGAVGNISAGVYYGVYTFYNTETDAESNPSPTSAALNLSASKQVDWTNLGVSTNAQVNARRLYRTLKDQEGVYFLVGQVNDNVSTSVSENTIQAEMGVQASFDNGVPPANIKINEVWVERMWVSDGSRIYYSEFLRPESYGEFNVIDIDPDDGESVTGLINFGDVLIATKTNSTYIITTVDGFSFRTQAISREHGSRSHASMKAAEGRAFWFGGDNFYETDGSTVRAIGDEKMRTTVDAVNPADYERVTAAIDESLGWYLAVLPTLGKIVCFNYRTRVWTTFTFRLADNSLGAPTFIADFIDSDERAVLYCNLAGGDADSVFQFNSGNTDDGRPIECSLTSKYFGFSEEQELKVVGDITFQVTPVAGYMNVSLLRDDQQLEAGPKQIYLQSNRQWFRAPLATNKDPGAGWALKLTYAGVPSLDVLGFGMTITPLGRIVPVSELT